MNGELQQENKLLRARLAEAEQALAAIREGQVDAVVVHGSAGPQVFSLSGAETIYRRVVETMGEAALNTSLDGTILFCNERFGEFIGTPPEDLPGRNLVELVAPEDQATLCGLLRDCATRRVKARVAFCCQKGLRLPTLVMGNALADGEGSSLCLVAADLTELENSSKIQAELRESEERLRLAMSATATGMWDWDLATDAVTWSPECFVIHGREEGDFAGTAAAFGQLVHPDDRERMWASVQAAIAEQRVFECEFRLFQPTGEVRWVSNLGRAFYDEQGQPVRMIGTINDITERKRAVEALRLSKERLEKVVQVEAVGVMFWDLTTGRLVDANDTFLKMMGYSRSDVATQELTWQTFTPPEYYELSRAELQKFATTGRVGPYEKEYFHKDGTRQWLLFSGSSLGNDQCVEFCVDIADRKKAEHALARSYETFYGLVNDAPLGVYIVDSQFRVAQVSAGAQAAFRNVRPLIGHDFAAAMRILWPEPFATDAIERFRNTLATGESYTAPSLTLKRNDLGVTESYEWQIHRITMPDGTWGVVCYFYESTEIRQAEQQLRDANRKKSEFLATLAHELRNPLFPIRTGLHVMKLKADDEQVVENSREMMERQVEQMARLIDDLMDVSRIDQGKIELRRERVELAQVVDAAVETSRPLLEEFKHRLTISLPSEPVVLDADITRLSQVFLNLLNNAAKYTEPGGRIELVAQKQGDEMVVSVRDTGIGIPADALRTIFEKFTQVDKSLTRSRGGLGIGLSLVKQLVEMHGGSIEAHSAGPGAGSTFMVRLPVWVAADGLSERNSNARRAIPNLDLRALVVDDNRDAARTMAILLEVMGCTVRLAHDGEAALAAAEEFRPEVVLCDIGLPKVDGYEVCRRLRTEPWGKPMRLIAITGWGQDHDRETAKEAGYDHHLVKPVAPQALMKLLSELNIAQTPGPPALVR